MTDADGISEFVYLYILDSDLLEDFARNVSASLQINMKSNLWRGHGYDTGQLYKDIYSNYSVSGESATIVGGYTVEYGKYVISGVRGKGRAKSGPIDFLTSGLNKTLEAYL